MKKEADEIECTYCGVICEIIHEQDMLPSFCPFCSESIVFSNFDKVIEEPDPDWDDDDLDEE